jgi:hypothetical protein
MPPRKTWVYAPSAAPKAKVPDNVKARVQAEADRLIEAFKPRYVKSPPEDLRFNYLTNLYTKWHRSYLYLCATFACPDPNALSPSFEAPFTRLDFVGGGCFSLAYMRHTGKWQEVYPNLSLEEAVESIRDETLFHPPG